MLKVFLPMRETLAGRRGLSVEQVVAVLNAQAARG
jgi:hypothetical protein